jgi:hypothetical protein
MTSPAGYGYGYGSVELVGGKLSTVALDTDPTTVDDVDEDEVPTVVVVVPAVVVVPPPFPPAVVLVTIDPTSTATSRSVVPGCRTTDVKELSEPSRTTRTLTTVFSTGTYRTTGRTADATSEPTTAAPTTMNKHARHPSALHGGTAHAPLPPLSSYPYPVGVYTPFLLQSLSL